MAWPLRTPASASPDTRSITQTRKHVLREAVRVKLMVLRLLDELLSVEGNDPVDGNGPVPIGLPDSGSRAEHARSCMPKSSLQCPASCICAYAFSLYLYFISSVYEWKQHHFEYMNYINLFKSTHHILCVDLLNKIVFKLIWHHLTWEVGGDALRGRQHINILFRN